MIIAIDGPAGSGKSTTARRIAEETGFVYLDTGAMYRAVALRFLEMGLDAREENIAKVFETFTLEFVHSETGPVVKLNGRDVSREIRSSRITDMSSRVSALTDVRERLVSEQRRLARAEATRTGGVVVEGRDIGSVVFPEADLKIYLDASTEERAKRRAEELSPGSGETDVDRVADDIRKRDRRDSTRAVSPLLEAEGAVKIDTTSLTFEEQVEKILDLIRERRQGNAVK